ncbi:hypothetical protein ICM05_09970 [Leucobacter sp. cx-42]|uniref:hypothetical protein n=1 Tax=unclassified Leucobacter TaxID=2621730 RepID=UPI00165D57A3|nr:MULTISPECIES: hypothetical protein [unclassified Leucobacter]MBC9954964.1 hypothetical protein [Leucobacter sp. cx-42]
MNEHLGNLEAAAKALEAAHEARDTAIINAHKAGTSTAAISRAVGLSRMHTHRIITAWREQHEQPHE